MLYENENYEVVVGRSTNLEEYNGDLYHIKNKISGVVEIETRIYPQAMRAADELNMAMKGENLPEEDNVLEVPYSH